MSLEVGIGAWLAGLDARIWQAAVAGGFLAFGWIFNGWQNRRDAAHQRAERLRDAHRAIFAEIEVQLQNLWDDEAIRTDGAAVIERMQTDRGFVPFIPRAPGDRLFRALESEIHILPRVTIDAIVAYYSQLSAVESLTEDMRGMTFRGFDPNRRASIYSDYIEMRKQMLVFGRRANRLIKIYAADGKDAAEAEARRLSSSTADRSDT